MSDTAVVENKNQKKLDTIVSRLITGMMFGIAVVAAFLFYFDVSKIAKVLVTIPVTVYVLAVVSTLSSYLIRFLKWHWMLKKLDIEISWKESFDIFFIGLSMSITPGKVGELLKAFLIKKRTNVEMSRSASAVFIDRLTDMFSMLILIAFGVSLYPLGKYFFVIFLVIFVGITIILRFRKLSMKAIHLITRIKFLQKHRDILVTFYDNAYELLKFRTFLSIILVSALAWFMECVSMYIFVEALHLNLTFIHDIFIFSFGTLAGAISFLPGGLGIAEGSIQGMLTFFKVNETAAASLTLLIRVVTLWLGVFIGLAVFLRKKKQYL